MAASARSAALAGLQAQRTQGTWPDQFVKNQLPEFALESRDAALAARLLYGVLQNRALIDFYLERYSKIKRNKIAPPVLDALRLGVYQIVFLDKIPARAAVNESVNLARKKGGERAAAFANGLLRTIAAQSQAGALPEPDRGDFPRYLAVRYSHPLWYVEQMIDLLGEREAEALCQADNRTPAVTARVNRLKTETGALIETLAGQGIEAEAHPWLPDCLVFHTGGDLTACPAFRQGLFYIQDPASQLPPWALEIQPGDNVIDLCAAPGGKSLIAAQMQERKGDLLAMDIHGFKCRELEQTARRYGADHLKTLKADSSLLRPELLDKADKAICDVPCSGMGILRKKTDIRFKTEEELAVLPALQGKILDCAAAYCRPGGRVVYSTCTTLPRENEEVVKAFLARRPDFALAPLRLPGGMGAEKGYRTFYPHLEGVDGFFIACLERKEG